MRVLCFLFLAILAFIAPVMAQPQLVTQHPAVLEAMERADRAVSRTEIRTQGTMNAPVIRTMGGGGNTGVPPVTLILNRVQFEEGQQLQASLFVFHDSELAWTRVWVVRHMIHPETNYPSGDRGGGRNNRESGIAVFLEPGKLVPVQNYVFDGAEAPGMYVFAVQLYTNERGGGGSTIALGTSFVFKSFRVLDSAGSLHIANTEKRGQQLLLRGNFHPVTLPEPPLGPVTIQQWVVIDGSPHRIWRASNTEAVVDLGERFIQPGIYDVTLLARHPGNSAYDSTTLPGGLRVYLTPPVPVPPGQK